MFKAHDDWVEGLLAASLGPSPFDERLLTFAADGRVKLWELDAEQGCDVYRLLVRVGMGVRMGVGMGAWRRRDGVPGWVPVCACL